MELTGFVGLGEQWRFDGGLTYVKGTLTAADGMGGTTETDEFFRRPRTTATAGLTFAARAPFLARLTGQYTGERPDVWFDPAFNRIETELEPYLLLNLYAEYRLLREENLKLFLDVRNLTDTDFVEVTGFSVQEITVRGGAAIRL